MKKVQRGRGGKREAGKTDGEGEVQEGEITETGRQGGENERERGGRDGSPTTHHPSSVFIKSSVSMSPGVEAVISPCRSLVSRGRGISGRPRLGWSRIN